MEHKLSVVIITFNEEDNIARCLKSIQDVADEILVVDSFSSDQTEQICSEFNVRFIKHNFEGHKEQKNYALKLATFQYVLSLDADEALSTELMESIRKLKNNFDRSGYKMNRISWYQGGWIRHGGWYPDTKLRLVNKEKAQWKGENPHDRLELINSDEAGFLKGDLFHYSFKDLADHAKRTNIYSTIAAREAFQRNSGYSTFKLIFNPSFTFIKKYVFQLGFMDGYNGFLIATMAAYGKFLKYSKLKEMHRSK